MKKSATKKASTLKSYKDVMKETLDTILQSPTKKLKNHFQLFADLLTFGKEYSPRNLMLVATQRENAIYTNGYKTWQKLGRQVKKGEKGIAIFAPCPVNKKVETENDKGETEEKHVNYTFFKLLHVFDYTQTKGEPVPEIEAMLEKRNAAKQALYALPVKNPKGVFNSLYKHAKGKGITISYDDMGANGGCAWVSAKELKIDKALKGSDLPVLIHEYAHITLGHNSEQDRAEKELEAELTTALVLSAIDLDITNQVRYLNSWARSVNGTRDTAFFKAFDKACPVALEIIDAISHEI